MSTDKFNQFLWKYIKEKVTVVQKTFYLCADVSSYSTSNTFSRKSSYAIYFELQISCTSLTSFPKVSESSTKEVKIATLPQLHKFMTLQKNTSSFLVTYTILNKKYLEEFAYKIIFFKRVVFFQNPSIKYEN